MNILIRQTLAICLSCLCFAKGNAQRPNIVWITIEDTSPDFIGCYGNSQVRTPNIDALAAEGIRMTNAFSTNTVCAPSRHTIITGVRTAEDGCGHHRSTCKIPSNIKGLAYYLKAAGYFTSNNQKTDYNIDDPKPFVANNWTMQGANADFTKRENKAQPFFSVFNLMESHQSRTMGNSSDWFEKNILRQLSQEEIIKPDSLKVPPFYRDDSDSRKNMARLYNALQVTDKKLGQIIRLIKNAGEWDNTIVFFFSDHGQGMPRFKTNSSRLGTQVPMVVRVPKKFQGLFNLEPGTVFSELVTFEDLAPTMISITKAAPKPIYMKGRIFAGDEKEPSDNVFWGNRDNTDEVIDMGRTTITDDWIYTRIYYPHLPVLQYQAYNERSEILKEMRADYKAGKLDSLQASIFNPRTAEYLFNRKTDQWETQNLANDKKYASVLAGMRKLHLDKMRFYQDIGFLPETVLGQIDRTDTILIWKQKNYRFERYREIAEMVGMGKAYLKKQLNLLKDNDSVVRYWAVIGLRNQQAIDLSREAVGHAFETETSDFVKVELADVLYAKFSDEKALQWIVDLSGRSHNLYIVRQAAMKLANIEKLPEPIVEQVRKIRAGIGTSDQVDMIYPIRAALGTVIHEKVGDDD